MPTYITVKVDGNSIEVLFNDLATHSDVNAYGGTYRKQWFGKIWHHYDPEQLDITLETGEKWPLSHDGREGTFPVSWIDLGDGNGQQVPNTIEELCDLLQAIIKQ